MPVPDENYKGSMIETIMSPDNNMAPPEITEPANTTP